MKVCILMYFRLVHHDSIYECTYAHTFKTHQPVKSSTKSRHLHVSDLTRVCRVRFSFLLFFFFPIRFPPFAWFQTNGIMHGSMQPCTYVLKKLARCIEAAWMQDRDWSSSAEIWFSLCTCIWDAVGLYQGMYRHMLRVGKTSITRLAIHVTTSFLRHQALIASLAGKL